MQTVDVAISGDVYTDSLIEGPQWAGTALTFSFPTSAAMFTGYAADGEPSNDFEALNALQQSAVRSALTQISSFTDLTFTEVTGANAASAVLRFGMSDDPVTAYGYLPDASDMGGDAWFNNSSGDYDGPVLGNYAWDTVMHEIGHTLGLGHPHESDPPMPLDRDSLAYTVMSYRSYEGAPVTADSGYTNGDWGFPQSYMIEDIAALQFMYGANFGYRNTDTTYSWSPTTGEMSVNGVGQGAPGGDTIFMTVWDGGGNDTYDFSNFDASLSSRTIDLRPGSYTMLWQQLADLGGARAPGNIATSLLYQGDQRSLIENAIGTSGNDTIHGNQAANHLVGGSGDDILYGYEGNDTLDGGDGVNQLWGGDGSDTLNGGSSRETLWGEAGDDTIQGDAGNDSINGGDGNDIINAGADDDSVGGGNGDDHISGGAGNDYLGGEAGSDTVDGGDGNDIINGGDGNDTLIGGAGNDTLEQVDAAYGIWAGAGDDTLIGGPGDDTYGLDSPSDTLIELAGEGTDTVNVAFDYVLPAAIENANLVNSHDYQTGRNLTGNDGDNILRGNDWSNVIDGGAGADTMRGGYGDDTYYVDNPDDFVYDAGYDFGYFGGSDTVYSSASYTLVDADPSDTATPGAWGDVGNYIEFLILTGSANLNATGNKFDNTIQGNSGANVLNGMDGNDTLVGNGGNDTLISGTGADTLQGDAGNDGLFFGAAFDPSDHADGGAGTDQVGLQGDYSALLTLGASTLANVETLVFLPGSDTRFGDVAGNHYSYSLATNDANLAAGQTLTVTWNTLQVGENVYFDGSAETDGHFLTYGGLGNDTVIGGQQNDGMFFGYGRWNAGDVVYGLGGSNDQLGLQGNYTTAGSGAIVFGADQLHGIETIVCLTGGDARFGSGGLPYSYDLTMNDANLAGGRMLSVSANTLAAGETLTFNGSAETNGSFAVFSGAGADTITGGAGADTIYGGAGADQLRGGAGNDTFGYISAGHSTSSAMDHILDFSTGDHIDLSSIDAVTGGANDAFHFIASAAFSHTAGELQAVLQSGTWFVNGDTNGDGTADLIIAVTSDHALAGADFVL